MTTAVHRTLQLCTLVALTIPAFGRGGQTCGQCTPDDTSPTGFSQFCRFDAQQSGRVPCTVEPATPPPGPSTFGADLDLTSADLPVCSSRARSTWQAVVDESLGATGFDLKGAHIRRYPAEKTAPEAPEEQLWDLANKNNWYPNDEYKQTMCGKIQEFDTFNYGGDEMDWNLFVIPNPAFNYLFADVVQHEGGLTDLWDKWPWCGDVRACVEVEVTPDEHFYENPWFRRSTRSSPLEHADGRGPTVCMYGPWVREWAHAFKPEIHPAELLWWKGSSQGNLGAETWWLMQLHDDSNRFDKRRHFDYGRPWDDPQPSWQPWAASPRLNMFHVVFRTPTSNGRTEFSLGQAGDSGVPDQYSSREVVTRDRFVGIKDSTSRRTHDLRYNGRVVARITERQALDSDIQVGYVGLCRNTADTELQGWVRIGTAISRSSDGEEGYHVMHLTKWFRRSVATDVPDDSVTKISPGPPLNEQTVHMLKQPIRDATASTGTLSRVAQDGTTTLVGQVNVNISALKAPGAGVSDVTTIVNGVTRRVPFQVRGPEVSLRVPAVSAEALDVRLTSGARIRVKVPTVGLMPLRRDHRVELRNDSQPALTWAALSKALAVPNASKSKLSSLSKVQSVRLEAIPAYGPLKRGGVAMEEVSPWSRAMNRVLRRGTAKERAALFGAASPVNSAWTFVARDVNTQAEVPVFLLPATSPEAIQIELLQDASGRSGFVAKFPSRAGEVFELVAKVKMSDGLGAVGEATYRFSSHVLKVDAQADTDNILAAVSQLADIPPEELIHTSRVLQPPLSIGDPGTLYMIARNDSLRRARTLRLLALQDSEDGLLSIGELNGLIRLAQLYKFGRERPVTPFENMRQRMTPR
jgi:hypothetical protein